MIKQAVRLAYYIIESEFKRGRNSWIDPSSEIILAWGGIAKSKRNSLLYSRPLYIKTKVTKRRNQTLVWSPNISTDSKQRSIGQTTTKGRNNVADYRSRSLEWDSLLIIASA